MRMLGVLVALILSPALASAQSIEVFATTGAVQLWDDEGNLGVGVPIGGGVGFRSPHGWGIEVLAETQKAKRNFDSDVRFDSTVTAGARAHPEVFRQRAHAAVRRWWSRHDAHDVDARLTRRCTLTNNVFRCTSRDIVRSESKAGTLAGFAGVRIAAGNVYSCARSSKSRGRASTCGSAAPSRSGRLVARLWPIGGAC